MLRAKFKAAAIGRGVNDVQKVMAAGFNPDLWEPVDVSPGRVMSSNLLFYDCFTDDALDTTNKWNRAQSTAGNVEIDSAGNRCSLKGNGSWGNNGAFTRASWPRVAGLTFQCDVIVSTLPSGVVVGFHDGAGFSYTDFAHCLDIYNSGTCVHVFENGNTRGDVGSGALPHYAVLRVRIRITSSTACTYSIQGCQYGGRFASGASFTTLAPGSNSSSTDPLSVGFVTEGATGAGQGNDNYIRNVLVYLS